MPAYGEARARRDWSWIRRAFARSFLTSAASGIVLTVPLALVLGWVLHTGVGPDLVPPNALVVGFCFYTVICSLAVPPSVFLYGLDGVGGQALIAVVTAVSTVLLGLWMTGEWGLAGMGWAMAGAFLLNLVGQAIQVHGVLKATASA